MKINPEKCAFGVPSGKFLEFLISERGIEANPKKISDIMEMKVSRTQKDIQKLAGWLASLRRFIPELAESCLPFFEPLKGDRNKKLIDWTLDCHMDFKEVKNHLMNPLILSKAEPPEPLSLYIVVGPHAISVALIWEEKGLQRPVYYNNAKYLKHKAARFYLKNDQLYRRTFSAPTLKCVDPEKAYYCLREVHEGIYGDHLAAKALAYKARGNLRYVLVAIDYMTKWAEAKAMRTINQQDCIKFMDYIVMRFGIPVVLVSDNGPQFVGSDFEAYLKELGIKHKRCFVAYPQGNWQVEVTNRTILRGLEKRLEESKKTWPDEIPKVMWSCRTTPG
ncbi:uncharacterized protein LOC141695377 [Apium graveolens]|uniref:uncharacterized protein LOC141695377 n=1 Tax=Apium graveolens TaxID=4045 RepID=UPI003D7AF646